MNVYTKHAFERIEIDIRDCPDPKFDVVTSIAEEQQDKEAGFAWCECSTNHFPGQRILHSASSDSPIWEAQRLFLKGQGIKEIENKWSGNGKLSQEDAEIAAALEALC